jgi:hypothetical protein
MRDFNFTNYQDDDDYVPPHDKYIFGESIDPKRYSRDNDSRTPLISYDYIVLDENLPHSFHQECIDKVDVLKYFQILKQLSSTIISSVIYESDKDLHFHIYQPNKINKKLKALISEISGSALSPETTPSVGQFALYTSEERASRELNIKSPRIYFILINATYYILFYDPFHEINPN